MFETREQVLEKVLLQKKPLCPNCNVEMSIWEVPPMNFGDGLGWGVPYLFLCFNDDCPLYKNGWEHMKENYAHVASYRCMNYPGTDQYEVMPVFSPMGAQGQIIDDEALAAEETLKESIKKGFAILADCYVSKDGPAVLRMVLDPTEPVRVRIKAAEMLGDIGEIDAIEPLRNLKVGNQKLQEILETAISNIHVRLYTRECPFCAEIIKSRAKVCKHCGQALAGK